MNIPLALAIIRLIQSGHASSLNHIAESVGSSKTTTQRVIAECKSQLRMDIQWDRNASRYRIISWGIVNRRALTTKSV